MHCLNIDHMGLSVQSCTYVVFT